MSDDHDNWSARDRAPAEDEQGLRAALDEPQPTKRDATLALVDAADEGLTDETLDALEGIIERATDDETRQFAVEALGVAGQGVDGIETALDDDEEWVRAEAVVALSRTAPGATDLLEAALDDDSGWVRRNALIALAKTGIAGEDIYVDCIKTDPHPAVREYGAQFLRTGEDTERCVRILAAVLAREPNAFVRVKAAESLGEFGTERAQKALAEFGIQDASDDVRRTAKQALARARGVDPDALDVEDVPAPGTGPDTPGQRQAGPEPSGPAEYRQGDDGGRPPERPPRQSPPPSQRDGSVPGGGHGPPGPHANGDNQKRGD